MKDVSVNLQLLGISIILIELLFPFGVFLLAGLILNVFGFMIALAKNRH